MFVDKRFQRQKTILSDNTEIAAADKRWITRWQHDDLTNEIEAEEPPGLSVRKRISASKPIEKIKRQNEIDQCENVNR